MISNEEFIRESINLNLFFMRIMKEHLIFIEAGFTSKNQNLIRESEMLKMEAERTFAEYISVANGLVSPQVVSSGELVTNLTIKAEQVTELFTGISIDTRLTEKEKNLTAGNTVNVNPLILQKITRLNQRAITIVKAIIAFKERVYKDVLSCKITTHNYPHFYEHNIEEAKTYLNKLNKLQGKEEIEEKKDLGKNEVFWNNIMSDHAKFIRGLLDPTEVNLFIKAHTFGNIFDKLEEEAKKALGQIDLLPEVTAKSLKATTEIRDFKRQGTEGILGCKVKSIILPLLGDHVLREANHYLRLLKHI